MHTSAENAEPFLHSTDTQPALLDFIDKTRGVFFLKAADLRDFIAREG